MITASNCHDAWIHWIGYMANALVEAIDSLTAFVTSHSGSRLSHEQKQQIGLLNARVAALAIKSRVQPPQYDFRYYGDTLFGFCRVPLDESPTLHVPSDLSDWEQWIREFREAGTQAVEDAADSEAGCVWLTATEVGHFVGVSDRTARRWLRDGDLPYLDCRGMKYKFFLAMLEVARDSKAKRTSGLRVRFRFLTTDIRIECPPDQTLSRAAILDVKNCGQRPVNDVHVLLQDVEVRQVRYPGQVLNAANVGHDRLARCDSARNFQWAHSLRSGEMATFFLVGQMEGDSDFRIRTLSPMTTKPDKLSWFSGKWKVGLLALAS